MQPPVFANDQETLGNLLLLEELVSRPIDITQKIVGLKTQLEQEPEYENVAAINYLESRGITIHGILEPPMTKQEGLAKIIRLYTWLVRFKACQDDPLFAMDLKPIVKDEDIPAVVRNMKEDIPEVITRMTKLKAEITSLLTRLRAPNRPKAVMYMDVSEEGAKEDIKIPMWPTSEDSYGYKNGAHS